MMDSIFKLFLNRNFLNAIFAVYVWILGLCLGAIIACGVFVAPVVFKAPDFGVEIVKFESGVLMTAIFLKLNALLLFAAAFMAVYEGFAFRLSQDSRVWKIALFLSAAISVICILLFGLYYSPFIVEKQALGSLATQGSDFASMHAQSELVFKILFFSLCVSFLGRIYVKFKSIN